MREVAAPARVDVLFFRVGPSRFGADASQIVRIERAGFQAKLVDTLGMPDEGTRALVFQTPSGEQQVCVDAVEGVRTIEIDDLRRVPRAAGAPPGVLGIWLENGRRPVVLLDLPSTLDAPGGLP
jgi:chemotaxis signal transduction protein